MEESRERNRKSLLAAPTFFQERGERNRKSLLVDKLSDLGEDEGEFRTERVGSLDRPSSRAIYGTFDLEWHRSVEDGETCGPRRQSWLSLRTRKIPFSPSQSIAGVSDALGRDRGNKPAEGLTAPALAERRSRNVGLRVASGRHLSDPLFSLVHGTAFVARKGYRPFVNKAVKGAPAYSVDVSTNRLRVWQV